MPPTNNDDWIGLVALVLAVDWAEFQLLVRKLLAPWFEWHHDFSFDFDHDFDFDFEVVELVVASDFGHDFDFDFEIVEIVVVSRFS